MNDVGNVLWTLRSANGRLIDCVVRFALGGVQVQVLANGSPLISWLFPNGDEAMAWAEEEREALAGDQR